MPSTMDELIQAIVADYRDQSGYCVYSDWCLEQGWDQHALWVRYLGEAVHNGWKCTRIPRRHMYGINISNAHVSLEHPCGLAIGYIERFHHVGILGKPDTRGWTVYGYGCIIASETRRMAAEGTAVDAARILIGHLLEHKVAYNPLMIGEGGKSHCVCRRATRITKMLEGED